MPREEIDAQSAVVTSINLGAVERNGAFCFSHEQIGAKFHGDWSTFIMQGNDTIGVVGMHDVEGKLMGFGLECTSGWRQSSVPNSLWFSEPGTQPGRNSSSSLVLSNNLTGKKTDTHLAEVTVIGHGLFFRDVPAIHKMFRKRRYVSVSYRAASYRKVTLNYDLKGYKNAVKAALARCP